MAIDSSLFAADIPAGTYTAGDMVELKCIAGPGVVRSSRGAAYLKRITSLLVGSKAGSQSYWKIYVENSDWIDPAISIVASMFEPTALDERTGSIQSGNNCPLTPNSSWRVYAVATGTSTTTTVANSIAAIIDVDYPSVSAITDPDSLQGIPTSIEHKETTVPAAAQGGLTTQGWSVHNVDILKAGYEYALCKSELYVDQSIHLSGFVALSNAAGMGGLQRIMPITNKSIGIRNKVEYATRLQKGPMDIKYLLVDNTGTGATLTSDLILDFVKHKV